MVLAVQAEVAEEDQPAMASEVKHLQRDDAECKAMLAYLEESVLPEDSVLARKITLERPHSEVIDGCLYHENPHRPGKWCLVPGKMRPCLLYEAHGGRFAGHFGEKRVYGRYSGGQVCEQMCAVIVMYVWCVLHERELVVRLDLSSQSQWVVHFVR